MIVSECNFFSHGGIQRHAIASYTLPRQMPFCQLAPMLQLISLFFPSDLEVNSEFNSEKY